MVDNKNLSDVIADHERGLKKVEMCFEKYLEIMQLDIQPALQRRALTLSKMVPREAGGLKIMTR